MLGELGDDPAADLHVDRMLGTCGTDVVANLPRASQKQVNKATKFLKKQCVNEGVVITAIKNPSLLQQEWLKKAGWQMTLQYQGQYGGFGYGKHYPMQHWALVIKPWKEPKKVVAKKKVVK